MGLFSSEEYFIIFAGSRRSIAMYKTVGILFLLWSASLYGQQWEFIAPMPVTQGTFGFCELDGGNLLVAGSALGIFSTFIYDPKTNTWETMGLQKNGRFGAPMAKLLDGRVFYPSGS